MAHAGTGVLRSQDTAHVPWRLAMWLAGFFRFRNVSADLPGLRLDEIQPVQAVDLCDVAHYGTQQGAKLRKGGDVPKVTLQRASS